MQPLQLVLQYPRLQCAVLRERLENGPHVASRPAATPLIVPVEAFEAPKDGDDAVENSDKLIGTSRMLELETRHKVAGVELGISQAVSG